MTIRIARLEEVCEINPRAPKSIGDDTPVSFLPMSAVSEDGYVAFEEPRTFGEVKKGYTYFERGDVLVAKITPCFENGKATSTEAIQNKLGFGSTEFHVVRPSPDLDPKYVFYLLWSKRFRTIGEKGMTGSAGQKRVPADLLKRLEIPLPPLAEQKRIAAILDKADQLRQKRRQAIALLDSLTQSIFLEMFGDPVSNPMGWRKTTFASILAEPLRNGISPSSLGDVDFKVLTLSAITGEKFDCSAKKSGKFQTLPPARQRVTRRDFLICRGNGNRQLVGRGLFPDQDMRSTAFPDTIIAGRIDEAVVQREFLETIWNGSARTTNGTFKVNQGVLEGVQIMLPSFEAQKAYSVTVRQIKKKLDQQQQSLGLLSSSFSSLQHRAFSGQL